MISLIVATDAWGAIAIKGENSIPWHCPSDMAYFKKITTGNVVIMGENTWFSLPNKFRPLPDRFNIIISDCSSKVWKSVNPESISMSVKSQIEVEKKENRLANIIVMGGYSIYGQFLNLGLIDQIYINVLNLEVDRPEEDLLFFPFSPLSPGKDWIQESKVDTPELTSYIFHSKRFVDFTQKDS